MRGLRLKFQLRPCDNYGDAARPAPPQSIGLGRAGTRGGALMGQGGSGGGGEGGRAHYLCKTAAMSSDHTVTSHQRSRWTITNVVLHVVAQVSID